MDSEKEILKALARTEEKVDGLTKQVSDMRTDLKAVTDNAAKTCSDLAIHCETTKDIPAKVAFLERKYWIGMGIVIAVQVVIGLMVAFGHNFGIYFKTTP